MSSTDEQSEKMSYESPLEAVDVYLILLNKLDTAAKSLERNAKQAENTWDNQSMSDSESNSITPDKLTEFKEKALEMMKTDLKSDGPNGDHCLDMYLEEKVKASLKGHIGRQRATIDNLESELESVRKLRNLITVRTRDLETSLREKKAEQEQPKSIIQNEIKKRHEAVHAKHREMIRAVRSVTSFAFPGANRKFQEILGALLDQWFTPSPYLEEEEGWSNYVEFLLRTAMVTRHPDNSSMIRLVDFT